MSSSSYIKLILFFSFLLSPIIFFFFFPFFSTPTRTMRSSSYFNSFSLITVFLNSHTSLHFLLRLLRSLLLPDLSTPRLPVSTLLLFFPGISRCLTFLPASFLRLVPACPKPSVCLKDLPPCLLVFEILMGCFMT